MKAYHDVHIHNFLSTCSGDNQATVENYIKVVKELGIRLMGFANHTWDETVPLPYDGNWAYDFYKRQGTTFQAQLRSQIPERVEGLKILFGAETEYCGMYDVLGMGKEAALKLDFVLIPHTHVHMRNFVMPAQEDVTRAQKRFAQVLMERVPELSEAVAKKLSLRVPDDALEPFMSEERVDYVGFVSDFMVQSFRSLMNNETLKTYSDLVPVSVAHPFQPVAQHSRMEMLQRISDETYGELFSMAAARGIGLEINCDTDNPEDFRLFGIAKECGCRFTFGSDAHSRDTLARVFKAEPCANAIGLTEDDLMEFVRV